MVYKPLRDIEYVRMLMAYRPWLKEKSLDKKLSSYWICAVSFFTL